MKMNELSNVQVHKTAVHLIVGAKVIKQFCLKANEESPIDASGISLLVTERGASADADPAMSARIVLPQELVMFFMYPVPLII